MRGLLWRSHPDQEGYAEQENAHLGKVVNEAGGEVLPDERVRRLGSHHQKLVVIRRQEARRRGRRLHRRDRPLPRAGRRRAPRRRPAARRPGSPIRTSTGLARCATRGPGTGNRRPGGDLPRALDGSHAARSPEPVAGPHPAPFRPIPGRERVAAGAARSAPGRADGRAGAADLSGEAPAVPVRPAGRAECRPRLHQGAGPGPIPDLRRRPVPVVDRRRLVLRRRPAAFSRAAPDRGGAPVPRPGRADAGTAQPHRAAGGAGHGARGRRRSGGGVQPGERSRSPDLRSRQALCDRRCVDGRRVGQPEPALLDARFGGDVRRDRPRAR